MEQVVFAVGEFDDADSWIEGRVAELRNAGPASPPVFVATSDRAQAWTAGGWGAHVMSSERLVEEVKAAKREARRVAAAAAAPTAAAARGSRIMHRVGGETLGRLGELRDALDRQALLQRRARWGPRAGAASAGEAGGRPEMQEEREGTDEEEEESEGRDEAEEGEDDEESAASLLPDLFSNLRAKYGEENGAAALAALASRLERALALEEGGEIAGSGGLGGPAAAHSQPLPPPQGRSRGRVGRRGSPHRRTARGS